MITMVSFNNKPKSKEIKIGFLHHSTGQNIWEGDRSTFLSKRIEPFSQRIAWKFKKNPSLPNHLLDYNQKYNKNYQINEIVFPKASPYGWNNYPYDYYNIWVKNGGNDLYEDEPTLEVLTKKYQVIILKHCYPVCNIQTDSEKADINSDIRTDANYKLQYIALREKFHEFPKTKFIVCTGAAQLKLGISRQEALRARQFFGWVVNEWDTKNDNIYIWDLYTLQTEGGIYFQEKYASSFDDSHPNELFSERASHLLFNRIVDVIEHNGTKTSLTGEKIIGY
jgi:hypothetical protein